VPARDDREAILTALRDVLNSTDVSGRSMTAKTSAARQLASLLGIEDGGPVVAEQGTDRDPFEALDEWSTPDGDERGRDERVAFPPAGRRGVRLLALVALACSSPRPSGP
jgi:hypothetical protein